MNEKSHIEESNFERVTEWGSGARLDADLLLLDSINEAPVPREPRRMNFIFIALCTRGHASYLLDDVRQELRRGDVIIISEKHVFSEFSHSADLEGLCMVVSVSFFHEIVRGVSDLSALFLFARTHPVYTLQSRDAGVFEDYFRVIREKLDDTTNHFRRELIRSLLEAMFYDLSNVIYRVREERADRRRADDIFQQFIQLVEDNCREQRRVAWYARQLCITPKYLSEAVKSVSLRTPNEWIDNYVLLQVRVLLKNTSKSIKEIASVMHFPNQSFLGKFFKEHVGMSPSEYRKK